VTTSDSRVPLFWRFADSLVLSDDQRMLLLTRLSRRLAAGVVTIAASEQLRRREIALRKLADLVIVGSAAEPAAPRNATGSGPERRSSGGPASARLCQETRSRTGAGPGTGNLPVFILLVCSWGMANDRLGRASFTQHRMRPNPGGGGA